MKYTLLLILTSILLFSCKKETMEESIVPADIVVPYSAATYKVTVTLNWSNPQFTVPANVHVTALTGIVHARDTFLWKPGVPAGKGLEYIAEDGYDGFMNTELDSIIAHHKAWSRFSIPPPSATGTVETTLTFNTDFTNISFASMIAPSPDWFMGINSVNLFPDNKWAADITVPIRLYDAGTEDGDVFGYDNPSTTPQQPVGLLTPANASVLANGNATMSAIGTIRFVKVN